MRFHPHCRQSYIVTYLKRKIEALQRAFEYYTKPSHGKLVRRIDHEAEGAINQSKIEEWCRTQAATKQQ